MSTLSERAAAAPMTAADGTPPAAVRAQSFARPVGNLYLAEWTSRFSIASIILGEDLRPLWTNPAADAILAAATDFQLIHGVFACVDKAQGPVMRAFLAGLGDEPEAWIYSRDDTHQLLRAEAVRPAGLPPATAVMIYPVDREDRFLWSDFPKVFGLTRAETVVVKLIVGGASADMIAEELSVALDTVRTHVRRIYAKLGVNNREQLFSRISPFRIR
jgi:DNA-binding CsgD family transcriptional regulator